MVEHSRFAAVVLPHLDAGYNLARWITRNVNDAEDVVQDASLRALTYVGSLRDGDARSWFLTIVRHAFYDWCKRNRPDEVMSDGGAAIETAIDDSAVDPELAALRKDESRSLSQALADLPIVFREVLVLREIEGLSYKQIAQVVGIPVGTVMSRLARARALLQRSPLLRSIRGRASGAGS